MMRPLLAAVLVLLTGSAAVAQSVDLRHHPTDQPGQVFLTKVESSAKQTLNIAGMAIDTSSESTAVVKHQVEQRDATGMKVKYSYDSLQVTTKLPQGEQLQFSSDNPPADAANDSVSGQIQQLLKAMVKTPWSAQFAPDGKLISVDLDEQAFAQVPEVFRNDVAAEKFRTALTNELRRLPEQPVNPGDSWTRDEPMNLNGGQTLQLKKTYTYKGRVQRTRRELDHITFSVDGIELKIQSDSLPLEVKHSDLKIDKSNGNLWYDPNQQRVVESEETMHVLGGITLVVSGNELPATVDLTIKVKSDVSPSTN